MAKKPKSHLFNKTA